MFFFRPVFLRLIVFYNFNFTRTFFWVFCYLRGWFTVLLFTCSCTWLFTTFINSVRVIFIWYFLCCRRLFSIHISSSLELSDYSWYSSPLISLSKFNVIWTVHHFIPRLLANIYDTACLYLCFHFLHCSVLDEQFLPSFSPQFVYFWVMVDFVF